MRTEMPRWCSHSSSLGTSAAAACAFGLETTPTVLMMGMEQKFLIPFGAEDGAVHKARLEFKFPHRTGHAIASGLMELRIANDPALAHLALADFELRFD